MGDTHYGDEAESWFYSYEGWASKKREELTQHNQEHLEGGEILDSQQPDEISSSYTNQSFLTGEADLLEIEQLGQYITVKVYKGGMSGQPIRLALNPKEARTLIMM